MRFEDCVLSCFENREFVAEYNRLTGHHIGVAPKRSPIEVMVDQATGFEGGIDRNEAHDFIRFIQKVVWMPVVLMEEELRS